MPSLPGVLADPMTRWMGRPATVEAVDRLSPGLVRMAFKGDALRGRKWGPGSEIEFRVSTRDFRHYTASAFDDEAGRIEVVFQLHGHGPGDTWVRAVTAGDEVLVLGPGNRSWLRPGTRHLFAGDASALGHFSGLIAGLPAGSEVLGAVEVPEADLAAAAALVPGVTVLAGTANPGDAVLAWLREHSGAAPDAAYLAGHAQSIQRHRAALNMRRQDVVTKPFWATGKAGL
ncbi:siderophore-interacting protein [Dactylosporangium sp. CS-033363]|uniref:siderophore-interacting protein n=1 Tax=Dactylosporangium sp. CS-033363 TaxID=3239935 RepID=UPI003D8B3145